MGEKQRPRNTRRVVHQKIFVTERLKQELSPWEVNGWAHPQRCEVASKPGRCADKEKKAKDIDEPSFLSNVLSSVQISKANKERTQEACDGLLDSGQRKKKKIASP